MSKLSKLITATITGQKAVVNKPYNVNMLYSTHPGEYWGQPYSVKVRFMAMLGTEHYIPQEITEDLEAISHILDEIRKDVVDEVFGEFRRPLREIRYALYEHKYEDAIKKLSALEEEMFNV